MKIIFGFDKSDLERLQNKVEALEKEIGSLKEENDELKRQVNELNTTVNELRDELGKLYTVIASLVNEIDSLKSKINDIEEKIENAGDEKGVEIIEEERGEEDQSESVELTGDVALTDDDGDKKLVLEAISKGINSPSDIVTYTGLSKSKVYAILKELTEEGILVKKKEGRRVHYIIASSEGVESFT